MDELKKEELEQMTALLNQYKKELKDFENNTGLAKVTPPFERKGVMNTLKEHIKQLELDIRTLESSL